MDRAAFRELVEPWLDAEDPLFILYTSGSTGRPKAVVQVQEIAYGEGGEPLDLAFTLTVEELKTRVDTRHGLLLDVRSAEEFDGELGHIPGALNIPLDQLKRRLPELADYQARRQATARCVADVSSIRYRNGGPESAIERAYRGITGGEDVLDALVAALGRAV